MTDGMLELLITWLWQGSALALFVACAMRVRPTASAATRYLLWWAVLTAILTLPTAGMLRLAPAASATATAALQAPAGDTAASAPALLTVAAPPTWLLTLVVAGWLGLVTVRIESAESSVLKNPNLNSVHVRSPTVTSFM